MGLNIPEKTMDKLLDIALHDDPSKFFEFLQSNSSHPGYLDYYVAKIRDLLQQYSSADTDKSESISRILCFLKNFYKIVELSECNGKLLAMHILYVLVDENCTILNMRNALSIFNVYLEDEACGEWLLNEEMFEGSIQILGRKLPYIGDFETQALLFETLCKIIFDRDKSQWASIWFTSEKIRSLVLNINLKEFEKERRKVLNQINRNEVDSRVFSFVANSISYGYVQQKKPLGYKDFWIDFNYDSQSISFSCLELNFDEEKPATICIGKNAIEKYTVNAEKCAKSQELCIYLNSSYCNPDEENLASNSNLVTITFPCYLEINKHLKDLFGPPCFETNLTVSKAEQYGRGSLQPDFFSETDSKVTSTGTYRNRKVSASELVCFSEPQIVSTGTYRNRKVSASELVPFSDPQIIQTDVHHSHGRRVSNSSDIIPVTHSEDVQIDTQPSLERRVSNSDIIAIDDFENEEYYDSSAQYILKENRKGNCHTLKRKFTNTNSNDVNGESISHDLVVHEHTRTEIAESQLSPEFKISNFDNELSTIKNCKGIIRGKRKRLNKNTNNSKHPENSYESSNSRKAINVEDAVQKHGIQNGQNETFINNKSVTELNEIAKCCDDNQSRSISFSKDNSHPKNSSFLPIQKFSEVRNDKTMHRIPENYKKRSYENSDSEQDDEHSVETIFSEEIMSDGIEECMKQTPVVKNVVGNKMQNRETYHISNRKTLVLVKNKNISPENSQKPMAICGKQMPKLPCSSLVVNVHQREDKISNTIKEKKSDLAHEQNVSKTPPRLDNLCSETRDTSSEKKRSKHSKRHTPLNSSETLGSTESNENNVVRKFNDKTFENSQPRDQVILSQQRKHVNKSHSHRKVRLFNIDNTPLYDGLPSKKKSPNELSDGSKGNKSISLVNRYVPIKDLYKEVINDSSREDDDFRTVNGWKPISKISRKNKVDSLYLKNVSHLASKNQQIETEKSDELNKFKQASIMPSNKDADEIELENRFSADDLNEGYQHSNVESSSCEPVRKQIKRGTKSSYKIEDSRQKKLKRNPKHGDDSTRQLSSKKTQKTAVRPRRSKRYNSNQILEESSKVLHAKSDFSKSAKRKSDEPTKSRKVQKKMFVTDTEEGSSEISRLNPLNHTLFQSPKRTYYKRKTRADMLKKTAQARSKSYQPTPSRPKTLPVSKRSLNKDYDSETKSKSAFSDIDNYKLVIEKSKRESQAILSGLLQSKETQTASESTEHFGGVTEDNNFNQDLDGSATDIQDIVAEHEISVADEDVPQVPSEPLISNEGCNKEDLKTVKCTYNPNIVRIKRKLSNENSIGEEQEVWDDKSNNGSKELDVTEKDVRFKVFDIDSESKNFFENTPTTNRKFARSSTPKLQTKDKSYLEKKKRIDSHFDISSIKKQREKKTQIQNLLKTKSVSDANPLNSSIRTQTSDLQNIPIDDIASLGSLHMKESLDISSIKKQRGNKTQIRNLLETKSVSDANLLNSSIRTQTSDLQNIPIDDIVSLASPHMKKPLRMHNTSNERSAHSSYTSPQPILSSMVDERGGKKLHMQRFLECLSDKPRPFVDKNTLANPESNQFTEPNSKDTKRSSYKTVEHTLDDIPAKLSNAEKQCFEDLTKYPPSIPSTVKVENIKQKGCSESSTGIETLEILSQVPIKKKKYERFGGRISKKSQKKAFESNRIQRVNSKKTNRSSDPPTTEFYSGHSSKLPNAGKRYHFDNLTVPPTQSSSSVTASSMKQKHCSALSNLVGEVNVLTKRLLSTIQKHSLDFRANITLLRQNIACTAEELIIQDSELNEKDLKRLAKNIIECRIEIKKSLKRILTTGHEYFQVERKHSRKMKQLQDKAISKYSTGVKAAEDMAVKSVEQRILSKAKAMFTDFFKKIESF